MPAQLLHHTPINIADFAISRCWDKPCDMANPNYDKIDRIANKFKHESTIEHLSYSFHITGVSRALLQEHARHRIGSFSVKSTRYTLGALKSEPHFLGYSCISEGTYEEHNDGFNRAKKYLKFTGNIHVDLASIIALDNLRDLVVSGLANDLTKYALPESFLTDYVWTVNARALRNFLSLRSSSSALWEIRDLASDIYQSTTDDHKFLFTSCMANQ